MSKIVGSHDLGHAYFQGNVRLLGIAHTMPCAKF